MIKVLKRAYYCTVRPIWPLYKSLNETSRNSPYFNSIEILWNRIVIFFLWIRPNSTSSSCGMHSGQHDSRYLGNPTRTYPSHSQFVHSVHNIYSGYYVVDMMMWLDSVQFISKELGVYLSKFCFCQIWFVKYTNVPVNEGCISQKAGLCYSVQHGHYYKHQWATGGKLAHLFTPHCQNLAQHEGNASILC